MAVDEDKPTRMADIIERCDRTQSWASKYRASLIRERVIELPDTASSGLACLCWANTFTIVFYWHE